MLTFRQPRSRSSSLAALGTWCAAVAMLVGAAGSPTTSSAAVRCTPDLQGAMDEPGQKDLTGFCIDSVTAAPSDFVVSWNWDDVAFWCRNSGHACALCDTDMDGIA